MNLIRPILVTALTLATAACSLAGGETPPAAQEPSTASGGSTAGITQSGQSPPRRVDPRRGGFELGVR